MSLSLLGQGKGYPDIISRLALRRFADTPAFNGRYAPLYGLFDHDPDGFAIFHTYKDGSFALSYDKVNLIVPRLRLLRFQSHQVSLPDLVPAGTDQFLLPMTQRDREKATSMLRWKPSGTAAEQRRWNEDLQSMLMTNNKAEIEILDQLPGGMSRWLIEKLKRRS